MLPAIRAKIIRYKEQFITWAKSRKVLSESKDTTLKVGDKVTFTNEYGCVFPDHEVLGFCELWEGRCVYIDKDSYWFPVKQCELKLV